MERDKHSLAVNNPSATCFNCLEEAGGENLKTIYIIEMGYGSGFDNWSTRIQLCKNCLILTEKKWWELEEVAVDDEYGSKYKYEDEIFEFASQMPLAGQELFFNRYSTKYFILLEPQDWIDYKLGILPHEKCKEYMLCSKQEIDAYNNKFPKCQHVVNIQYYDKPVTCRCPFEANGLKGQKASEDISKECYQCNSFIERFAQAPTIKHEDWEDYKVYFKYKVNETKLKNKFEKSD